MAYGVTRTSPSDFYYVIDALDAARGFGDVFGPGPDQSAFDISFERDHAVFYFDRYADDVLRDIPRFDLRQDRQVACRHIRAFSGAVSAVRLNCNVIDN